jgi:hypothetical protein
MALRALIDSLDDVAEGLRSEYKKTKVKRGNEEVEVFALDITGTDEHPDVANLRNAHQRVKQDLTTAKEELKALKTKVEALGDDFDPAIVQQLKDQIIELQEKGEKDPKAAADARKQLEQQIANLQKQVADLKKERDDAVAAVENELGDVLKGDGLTKALVEVGVEPKFMKAVTAMLAGQVKVEKGEDGKRKAFVTTNLGDVPVEKFVKDWAASDEGKEFVKKASGSGAGGGGDDRKLDVNPFLEDASKGIKPNLTKQGEIVKADPAQAERLMKAAGWTAERIAKRLKPAA